ncbi:MAG: hypothetical protein JSS40_00440 [Proteobacteria bacterium]|nr:hypothetical protein [Pseudomonadota bacterium]
MQTDMCGDPLGPFMHAQNFPNPESVLDLVALNLEFERKVDPGVECDTILVNNDTGWRKGNSYLASIDGSRTFAGRLTVLNRGNFGTSLGGYNHAYERFRDRYDYWTFTEDDILISGERWYARCIETFESREDTGFVAIQGLSREHALHAHGGVGTTHVRILDAVRRTWGSLPHRQADETQTDHDHIIFGEVLFTNLISRMGHRLVTMDADPPLYTFAYDHMRNTRGMVYRPGLLRRALRKVSRVTESWAEKLD